MTSLPFTLILVVKGMSLQITSFPHRHVGVKAPRHKISLAKEPPGTIASPGEAFQRDIPRPSDDTTENARSPSAPHFIRKF